MLIFFLVTQKCIYHFQKKKKKEKLYYLTCSAQDIANKLSYKQTNSEALSPQVNYTD
jgi:hypothetical protein